MTIYQLNALTNFIVELIDLIKLLVHGVTREQTIYRSVFLFFLSVPPPTPNDLFFFQV